MRSTRGGSNVTQPSRRLHRFFMNPVSRQVFGIPAVPVRVGGHFGIIGTHVWMLRLSHNGNPKRKRGRSLQSILDVPRLRFGFPFLTARHANVLPFRAKCATSNRACDGGLLPRVHRFDRSRDDSIISTFGVATRQISSTEESRGRFKTGIDANRVWQACLLAVFSRVRHPPLLARKQGHTVWRPRPASTRHMSPPPA